MPCRQPLAIICRCRRLAGKILTVNLSVFFFPILSVNDQAVTLFYVSIMLKRFKSFRDFFRWLCIFVVLL